jgi:ketosteroid isomerase-like protein
MKLLVTFSFLLSLFCAGLALALKNSTLLAADEEPPALLSDHLLIQAMAKGDKSAADALLDSEFTWTDRSGRTRARTEVLPDLKLLAAGSESDLELRKFDQILLITGNRHASSQNAGVRFARVWIKRPSGWTALIYQETAIADKPPATRAGFGSPSGGASVDCDNPCKNVPYEPEGAAEQEVVAMWQAVERTVLTNDVDAWTPNFTDEFVFVTPDGGPPLHKADRIAMIRELKRTNTTLIPAQVDSMKVWVLGDAAVMRSEHKPHHGKMLHVTRVFVKRDGRWQITFGQQTTVE